MSDIVHRGIHPELEAEADAILRESLQGVTKHSEKSDILTPWKQQERYRREVYVASGVPDSTRKGMFNRVANPTRPELNSRDGSAPSSRALEARAAFNAEHDGDGGAHAGLA